MNTRDCVVKIDTLEKINKFINTATNFESSIDIICGNRIVDAESVMGIMGLDISKPLIARINSNNDTEIKKFKETMEEFGEN